MFTKWMAQMGVGSAKVDTRIEEWQFVPGQMIEGIVWIRGGQVTQVIDDIVLDLVTSYQKNGKKEEYVYKRFSLSHKLEINPSQERRIPFEIKIPTDMPMSTGRFPVYLKTALDVKVAVDPTDSDRIEIFPTPLVSKILKQIEDNGFLLYKIDNTYDPDSNAHPFYQCFTFRPTDSFHAYIDQFNVIFHMNDHDITIDMELVRSDQGLTSVFYWEHEDPVNTLTINGQRVEEDPLEKLEELLQHR